MGRDASSFIPTSKNLQFQPTRPHGARPPIRPQPAPASARFNPRARMGRDVERGFFVLDDTKFQPTRPHGARHHGSSAWGPRYVVSTHAPAWGATLVDPVNAWAHACFNPRARMGRDRIPWAFVFRDERFNPRARMGRDLIYGPFGLIDVKFQPTRPHGARPACSTRRHRPPNCFNPRARMGRDSPG